MRLRPEVACAAIAVLLCLAVPALAGAQRLPEHLEKWKADIERRGEPLVVVRVTTDAETGQFRIPPETPRRFILARYLADERFREQFRGMYAMTLNYRAADGVAHFVLLNAARAAEYGNSEEPLLAHEFGHVWLDVVGFRSLDSFSETAPCLATHSSDLVQHVLIRRELDARGIPFREHWINTLVLALEALKKGPPAPSSGPCDTLARIAVWADAKVGLRPETWSRYNELDAAYRSHFPELAATVDELTAVLTAVDVTDPARYGRALVYVRKRLAVTAGLEPGAQAPRRTPSP